MAIFFARDLSVGESQNVDAYLTALRSRGFLQTGDWTAIHQCGALSFNKPPLQYMLTAGTLSTHLSPNLALRIWPFVFTVGTVALTGLLAALVVETSRWWAAMCAVALVSSSPWFWATGRDGLLDAGQNFFLLLALSGALLAARHSQFWLVSGLGVGLGFLQKTPVALFALAILICLQTRWNPSGGLAWRTLWRDSNFRIAALIAAAFFVFWPALEAYRHGSEFLSQFFVHEMLERFAPQNPADTDSIFKSVTWLAELLDDAPQVWVICVTALVAVLVAPAFRKELQLRGLAVFIGLVCLIFTLAGQSYILLLMPLLAAIGAAVLVYYLPAPEYAATISILLMSLSLPSLAKVPTLTQADRREIIEVSQIYKQASRKNETPVFVSTGNTNNDFDSIYFCYYAGLSNLINMPSDDLEILFKGKRSYSGIVRKDHFSDKAFEQTVKVTEIGRYVIWRKQEAAMQNVMGGF
jgi:4-amino-4-deoxy-L-arabinose transferase-like glycosyltransferase